MRLRLAVLSDNHFIQEPAAASTFAIMSNPHPADVPDGYSLNYKLIQLHIQRRKVNQSSIDFTPMRHRKSWKTHHDILLIYS